MDSQPVSTDEGLFQGAEREMSRVIMTAAVSLDGYIAHDDHTVGPLFDFYGNGTVPMSFSDKDRVFHVTQPTAHFLSAASDGVGASVIGRTLFNLTNGWGGVPADGDHVFVVTHQPPVDWEFAGSAPFTFVTGGVEEAVVRAKAFCGDRNIVVTAGDIGGQALRAGLVDRIVLNLVPVVLGRGRPFFGTAGLVDAALVDTVLLDTVLLENPTVVQGDRVTHLAYDVRH